MLCRRWPSLRSIVSGSENLTRWLGATSLFWGLGRVLLKALHYHRKSRPHSAILGEVDAPVAGKLVKIVREFHLRRSRRGAGIRSALDVGMEVLLKPFDRDRCHSFQGTRLSEKMGGARDESDSFLAPQLTIGVEVELHDPLVAFADNEQRRRFYAQQMPPSQVGSTAS